MRMKTKSQQRKVQYLVGSPLEPRFRIFNSLAEARPLGRVRTLRRALLTAALLPGAGSRNADLIANCYQRHR